MLTESQTSKPFNERTIAVVEATAPIRGSIRLALVGFVIHHFLPLRFRRPSFAGLSLVAVITAVGHLGPNVITGWMHGKSMLNSLLYHLVPGLTLIRIGLGLIGICHLPIRFGARVGLVANNQPTWMLPWPNYTSRNLS